MPPGGHEPKRNALKSRILHAYVSLMTSRAYIWQVGTHIQPMRNWRFLETRMAAGLSFGRYITKEQALTGIRRYQVRPRLLAWSTDWLTD